MQRKTLFACLTLLLSISLWGCQGQSPDYSAKKHSDKTVHESAKEKGDVVSETSSITLAAVGDILIHDRVYRDAKEANGYNFMPMLQQVQPYLAKPTVTTANQETMIGGQEIGLSSYPSFNSPVAVGDALKESGVDVVSLANNHTLDRGETAVQNAIAHWDNIDMMYTGAYQSQKDSERIRVLETEANISLAFLSYTYGTNGIPTPSGKGYLVNRIDREKIADDVEKAKQKADVIVMQLHFGTQYERMPNNKQKELVQYVSDLGVDVVFGHHPHVLQPVDWVTGKDGNRTFVIYSLGNFLSGQDEFYRRIGGIAEVTIEKRADNEIILKSPKFLVTFLDFTEETETNYQVVPMFQLTEEQLPQHQQHYQEMKQHVSQWMPKLEFIEK
ncbi:hypothetical protein Pryu01_02559 [Paraliobacillus ryukyuensis]|uniref:Poly-gamma-glutamate synthesis protein (Capsule biosynthesis protein) n=1 Tax=Paraliobacillus ryukyuensis TaxID=200904 RepID=A0A366EE04_9BACI|nr:CapA family protein [Paraliobacillus ryukyuensis]RBO99714.1 poly-gamma-glutamate synthesis protein (capsule biosynthesis protein) [Paraliobacillus ryukyuensis]